MRPRFWMTVVSLLLVSAFAHRVGGQARGAAATTTTRSGVYTAAQANRGEQTYMASCVSCHPPATYKGAVFLNWHGRTVSELFEFLTEQMPKSEPGSLAPKEYAQVIAYLLKLNGMPAGRTELPSDAAALQRITILVAPGTTDTPSHAGFTRPGLTHPGRTR